MTIFGVVLVSFVLLKMCLLLQIYFPNIYDIKYLMKFCGNLHGGLNKLAESLEVKRLGPQHQVLRNQTLCRKFKKGSSSTFDRTAVDLKTLST